jgi:uncharacterized protein
MAARPWTITADGLMLSLRLTPKGGRDAIEGIDILADGRAVLRARVRAVASDGAANAALASLLGKALGVATGRIHLVAGATGRVKRLRIDGDGRALAAALERLAT